ncbi:MAG: winged helix-turn-helix domain-containing protein [Gemmatimonadota bacterium]
MKRSGQVVRFGPFEFDFDERVLRRDGEPVPLQPQPTEVLAALLDKPGRLVPRAELQEAVWRYRSASLDPGLNFLVRQVRRGLGDRANPAVYVETVHRRGYRFIAPVESAGASSHASSPSNRSRAVFGSAAAVLVVLAGAWAGWGHWNRGVAGELSGATLQEPTRTTFEAARWLYEQGEFARSLVRLDSVRMAEPTFGEAWSLTARARIQLDELEAARSAAERAIAIDDEDAAAYDALGVALFYLSRGALALRAFERAVELKPRTARYRQWYAQTLANALRFDEAIFQLEEARRVDPVANLVGVDLAGVYLAAGRYQDALAFCSASLELAPDGERWARDCLMSAHYFLGESGQALGQSRGLMRLEGATDAEVAGTRSMPAYFSWDLARIDRAREEGAGFNPFTRARATARLRDRRATLDGLQRLGADRDPGLQWAPRDAWFRFLHGDPEFEAILREAGLPVPRPESHPRTLARQ